MAFTPKITARRTPPDAPAGWPSARVTRWADASWWNAQIDQAITDPDPANVNARITLLHRELSLALTRVIGEEAGPSYHAWAVWASVKAGRVIRTEEAGWVKTAVPVAGLTAGAVLGATRVRVGARVAGMAGGALLGALAARAATRRAMARASAAILAGNVAVIDDIGRHSARFACTFADVEKRTPEVLHRFLAPLSSAPSAYGGQSLLRDAYRHYFMAAVERDPRRRDQAMLLANLSILLHEHWRLQQFFDASIPRPGRRLVTAHGLAFQLGSERLSVGRDLTAPAGAADFPATLTEIVLPELRSFLDHWDRTAGTPTGSAASDWCRIGDRINYIVALFRTRHHDANVRQAPFGPAEQARILGLSEQRRQGTRARPQPGPTVGAPASCLPSDSAPPAA